MANTLITSAQAAKDFAEIFDRVCDAEDATPEQRRRLLYALGAWIGGFPPQVPNKGLREEED